MQHHSIDISVDVSWTGDLPGRYVDRPGPKTAARRLAGVERPAFERHDLPKERVAVRIWTKPQGPPAVGFVTNGSVTGMWIETDGAMPLRTQVQVELVVPGGYSATLGGRVVRANAGGMAVHLNTEDSTWQFRSSFLELARKEDGPAPSVIVRLAELEADDVTSDLKEAGDFRVLGGKWHEVLADLHDDRVHQEFIQECLRRQRLEFGLERYRELKGGPDDATAAKYLGQIGVILGFMSLKKNNAGEQAARSRMLKIAFAIVAVAGALTLARQLFMTKAGMVEPPPAPIEVPRVEAVAEPAIEAAPQEVEVPEEKALWELPKKKK